MRIQIEMSEGNIKELQSLMEQMGVKSYKDLFNCALSLLESAVLQAASGRKLAVIDEADHEYRALILPELENVHRNATSPERGQGITTTP
jgi:hypothetical protein